MTSDSKAHKEIRKIAYALWMEQGQPDGHDREHWERAKAIWAFHHSEAEPGQVTKGGRAAEPAAPDRRGTQN